MYPTCVRVEEGRAHACFWVRASAILKVVNRPNAFGQFSLSMSHLWAASEILLGEVSMSSQIYIEEYRSVLSAYGWHEDPGARGNSSQTWFPPDYLQVPAITLAKRAGVCCWSTLDFEHNERVEVSLQSLREYLKLRQPDVDVA